MPGERTVRAAGGRPNRQKAGANGPNHLESSTTLEAVEAGSHLTAFDILHKRSSTRQCSLDGVWEIRVQNLSTACQRPPAA